jgi:uncharacterized GH25 family protein
MKPKLMVFLLFFISSQFLAGHEFWIQPQRFHFKRGETVNLRFRVGENFDGENWNGSKSGVKEIKLFYNGMHDELLNLLSDSTTGDSLSMQFYDEGTVMVAYHSNNKYITLEPEKFLSYLKEDGLNNAIDFREKYNETDSVGKEFYQRNVKSLLQIGTKKDSTFKKHTGLPLDIIPLRHPYLLKKGQSLPVKVLFEEEPLVNQLVKLWHKKSGKVTMVDYTTNKNGVIYVPVSLIGQYMVSTVKMSRIETDSAQWQSYWGSLTWGY